MSEGLKRFRRPAAWLVLTAVVVLMAVDVVRLVLAVRGPSGMDAFAAHSLSLLSPVHAIVLLLAVAWCAVLRPITPGARTLTIAALVVALIGTLAQFAFGVIGLVRAGRRAGVLSAVIDAIGYLGFTILPVVAVVALAKILGGLRREEFRRIEAQELTVELPRPGSAPATVTESEAPAEQTEPTWRPDEASGAAWQTAGSAASGARASGWGRPGERSGWLPADREPAEMTREDEDEDEEATVIRRQASDPDRPEPPQPPAPREPPQWKPVDRG